MNRLRALLAGTDPREAARGALAALSVFGIGVGCYLMWPPLAFVVPSSLILACLVWSHLRGGE